MREHIKRRDECETALSVEHRVNEMEQKKMWTVSFGLGFRVSGFGEVIVFFFSHFMLSEKKKKLNN